MKFRRLLVIRTQGQTLLVMCFQACKLWDSFQCLLKYSPPHFTKQVIWKDIENDYVSVEWMWYYSQGTLLCIGRSERCSLQEAMLTSMSWSSKIQQTHLWYFLHSSLHSAIGICRLAHHWHYWFIWIYYLSLGFFFKYMADFYTVPTKTMWPRSAASSLPLLIPHLCHIVYGF